MEIKQKIILIIILAAICGFACANSFALAQEVSDYPTAPGAAAPDSGTTLPQYIKYLFNLFIAIGGILAFIVFVVGGAMWVMSAGNPGIISVAKSRMLKGIMGLALLLASYLIIHTINPDLTILTFEDLVPRSFDTPEYVHKEINPKIYKEIPIGLLIEEILAKNISCFDADGNLMDCRSREILQTAKTNIFATDTHYNYCYEYDEDGNKKELLKYQDRFACIKKLEKALLKKSVDLKVVSEELKMWSELLKEKSQELKNYAHNCTCLRCRQICRGCGCNKTNCTCSCSNNVDLCPDRQNMDILRRATIPFIIEQIEKKRIESREIIYGADPNNDKYIIYQPNSHLGSPIEKEHYFKERDTDTPEGQKFLTIQEALTRLYGLKGELKQDLDYLKEAEELAKYPYGKRLSLAEYQEKALEGNIEKAQFKNIDITEYCKDFHCVEENNGICTKYELNPAQGKLCDALNLDGEPATFYFPTQEPSHYQQNDKIVFETKNSSGEAGMPDITIKAPALPPLPVFNLPAPGASAPPASPPATADNLLGSVWVAPYSDTNLCYPSIKINPVFRDSPYECCKKHFGRTVEAKPVLTDLWNTLFNGVVLPATKYNCYGY